VLGPFDKKIERVRGVRDLHFFQLRLIGTLLWSLLLVALAQAPIAGAAEVGSAAGDFSSAHDIHNTDVPGCKAIFVMAEGDEGFKKIVPTTGFKPASGGCHWHIDGIPFHHNIGLVVFQDQIRGKQHVVRTQLTIFPYRAWSATAEHPHVTGIELRYRG
jgi:hypothetical protein